MTRLRAPIRRKGNGYVIDLGTDETALLRRLLAELREMLTHEPGAGGDDTAGDLTGAPPEGAAAMARLFPVAHADDPELEAEYQRLMRDDLVASRIAAIDRVDDALESGRRVDEDQLVAFMQSVNSIRLVLGTLLGVTDDAAIGREDGLAPELAASPEYQLYGYLSWVLDTSVHALSGA